MTYRLIKHRGGDENALHFVVFPIRGANFVEIEHQFGYTDLYVVVQTLNWSLEKYSRSLQALPFL
jgi:hypothetical protein